MLSVLIPVYNYDVSSLVHELYRQAAALLSEFEIIVMEDGSTLHTEQNATLSALDNCRYIPLSANVGRAAIRNRLADEARYGQLLFIDCDAEVQNSDFIGRYLSFRDESCVVVGGTAYDPAFDDPSCSLRLKYGRTREARTAEERERMRFKSFTTFNFLISKSIFRQVRFDETISGYGYEDTLFSIRLTELGYTVKHIDNPLVHRGVEPNDVYLRKAEVGLANLYRLHVEGRYPCLANDSHLMHTFLSFQRRHLTRPLGRIFPLCRRPMRTNLLSSAPSLRVFDLYKLLYLCYLSLGRDKLA